MKEFHALALLAVHANTRLHIAFDLGMQDTTRIVRAAISTNDTSRSCEALPTNGYSGCIKILNGGGMGKEENASRSTFIHFTAPISSIAIACRECRACGDSSAVLIGPEFQVLLRRPQYVPRHWTTQVKTKLFTQTPSTLFHLCVKCGKRL
jgi:hypothetical protein